MRGYTIKPIKDIFSAAITETPIVEVGETIFTDNELLCSEVKQNPFLAVVGIDISEQNVFPQPHFSGVYVVGTDVCPATMVLGGIEHPMTGPDFFDGLFDYD